MNHRLSQKIRKKVVKTGDKSECHLCQKYAKEGNLKLVLYKPSLVEFVLFTFHFLFTCFSSFFFLKRNKCFGNICAGAHSILHHTADSRSRAVLCGAENLCCFTYFGLVLWILQLMHDLTAV